MFHISGNQKRRLEQLATFKNKNKSKGIKYDIPIERKLNSSADGKGGFITHGNPGCAGTLDTHEATSSLEDTRSTQGIVLTYS